MLAFPGMLVEAAKQAGMKCPPNPDSFDYEEYPHFAVFCAVQLARRMEPGEHFENAKVVAAVPEDKIRSATLLDLMDSGLMYSF